MMGRRRPNRNNKPNRYLNDDDRKNDLLSEYYKGQFNWSEEQWNAFYETMKTELPATFRVTGFREQSEEVQWLIKNKFLDNLIDTKNVDVENVEKRGPLAKVLPWYPGGTAWQLNASKVEIRKTPELKKLHKFLISETDCGFISRQEAVSMLPPLLLDIESHHKVLDLCAAPGSKTAQLLEMLHSGTTEVPTGLVIANDIDSKRCYMMVHQLQRLQSPCCVVVRQDASIFPRMFLPDATSKTGQSVMQFDRILADVPCSGDGTLRKNQDLWPRWSPFLAINEHFLQMKILRRSLEMLADGGRMVYSTCSLNPIEDEAVIASVLSQCNGAARLVDISDRLKYLITENGMDSWSVMLKNKTWCKSIDEVPQDQRRSIRQSLFPPENVSQLNLKYCKRILPQSQNTGGFFVALIEKVCALPWTNAAKKEMSTLVTSIVSGDNGDGEEENKIEEEQEVIIKDKEEDKIAKEEDKIVKEEDKIAKEEDKIVKEEDKIAKEEDKIAKEEDKTVKEEDKTVKEEDKTVKEEDKTVKEEDKTVKEEDKTVKEEDKTVKEEDKSSKEPLRKKARIFKEDPFLYIKEDDVAWSKLEEFYDINPAFAHKQLMYRNADGKRRNYYFTNELLKQLVESNCDRDINFVNLGVKVFGLSEDKLFTGYRLLQEGVEIVEPFLGLDARRLTLPHKSDLVNLLTYDMPLISEFSIAMQQEFNKFSIGPILFQYFPQLDSTITNNNNNNNSGDSDDVTMPRIALKFAGWRGRSSIRHYVGVHERSHLLRLCGLEPVDELPAARKNGVPHITIINETDEEMLVEEDVDNTHNIIEQDQQQ